MAATIIIASLVALAAGLAIRSIVRDHRQGVGACGYKCSECAHHCASDIEIPERFKLKS